MMYSVWGGKGEDMFEINVSSSPLQQLDNSKWQFTHSTGVSHNTWVLDKKVSQDFNSAMSKYKSRAI